jgi:hypothetical protein
LVPRYNEESVTEFQGWRRGGQMKRGQPSFQNDEAVNGGLVLRRIVSAAGRAVNGDAMDLIVIGVHEHRAASTASKVNGVIAGIEDWRGAHN